MNEISLKELAVDIVSDKVCGSWGFTDPVELSTSFMLLGMGGEELAEDLEKRKVVHVYEYMSKASPVSVNGMPCFMSMKTLTIDQWKELAPLVEKLLQEKKAFLEGESADNLSGH